MANTFKIKRSAIPAKIPTVSDIELGELALNTYDGKLFLKKNDGTESIVQIGAGGSSVTTSITAPANPNDGDLWWNEEEGQLKIYYDDGTSAQWVDTNSTSIGYTGSQGTTGFVGSTGLTGFTGSQGIQGVTGFVGSTGTTGFVGSTGTTGFTGSQGIQGIQGTTGFTGSQGIQGTTGFVGSQGIQGVTGFVGSQGTTGFTGSQGTQGVVGFTGSVGFVGSTGSVGFVGSRGTTGFTGSQGIQGVTGFVGSQGIQGIQGVTGFTGSTGNQGVTGFTGSTGSQGVTGFTGSVGFVGSRGTTGFTGSQGTIGFTGSVGFVGSQGIQGVTGFTGSVGFVGSASTVAGFTGSAGPNNVINAANDTATTLLYPVMVGAAGSAQTPKVRTTATALSYNASTGALTAGSFVGAVNATTGTFSGAASFAAGTAALPSITRTGDTNTGIFFPSADTIAFADGGVEAMRINSDGNVGIGTSSPGYKLEVNGSFAASNINIPTNTTPAVFIKDDNLTGWEYSGKSLSVAAAETGPTGLFFSPDGTRMYVIGTTGDDVNQYALSVAWDVTTASFVRVSALIGETSPTGVFFKPDGTVMYVTGTTNDTVREFSLSVAWDVSTITFVHDFSVAAQETVPQDLWFKPDGTKMYIVGSTGDDVNEYNLSTAWNISTATFVQLFSVAAQDTVPVAVNFSSDGTRMYVLGNTGSDINRYTLSTPWDISTAVFFNNFYVGFQELGVNGMFIDLDAGVAYVVGTAVDTVFQYSINTDGIELVSSSGLFVSGSLYANKNLVVTDSTRIDGQLRVSGSTVFSSVIDVASTATLRATVTMSTTTGSINLGTSQTTGSLTIGGTAQTGAITVGRSTGVQTVDIAVGATLSGTTKTVNLGTAGVSGSTTNINIGSAVSGSLGTVTIDSGTQVNGTITSTVGGSAISFTGPTSNFLLWNTSGVAAPSVATRSNGTKLVLYPNLSATNADYAIGIENNTLWNSVPVTSGQFRWYGGTTLAGTLSGTGNFTAVGTVAGTNITTGGNVTGSSTSCTGNAATSTLSVIQDTRAGQLLPDNYAVNRTTYEFTNQIVGSDWHSAMTMRGWNGSYASWQIIGPSSTSAHENWYLRSGINTTWNSARTIIHSGNIGSQSVNFANSATTATNQSGGTVNATTGVFSNLITGRSSASTDVNTANDSGSISIRGSAGTVAAMSFHRTGAFAINMGLGTDNVFRIGGWSASANAFQMNSGGDLTMLGRVRATTGTAALPAFSTAGDTNTGMYFPGADQVGFSIGGEDAGLTLFNYFGTRIVKANQLLVDGVLYFGTDLDNINEYIIPSLGTLNYNSNNGHAFSTSVGERMRIKGDGQLQTKVTGASNLTMDAFACRAWVNFNGTGTVAIRSSGNVSSITDNGTGNYTVNFANAMPDANYSAVFGAPTATDNTKGLVTVAGGYNGGLVLKTTTQLRITSGNGFSTTPVDFQEINVAIFR